MTEFDLFGERPTAPQCQPHGKHYTKPQGYYQPPGTGPAGETCGSCKHVRRIKLSAKTIHKCELASFGWTHGRGTDVLARSPACKKWEKQDD